VPQVLREENGGCQPVYPLCETWAASQAICAALRPYRLYCFACGRSSEVAIVPAHPGRCTACGGSMLTEDVL
jgi:hypothetical protein